MTEPASNLDDPDYARFAWGRYRRIMGWMTLVAVIAVLVSLAWLRFYAGPMPIHMVIATIAGVFFSVILTAALMGLAFLSSGSGHDDAVEDRSRPDID